jgi:hypothetical protein
MEKAFIHWQSVEADWLPELKPQECGSRTLGGEAKIRVATSYAVALIKAERKSEWTGMMNLGLPEGDKSHWMGE